ncbi:MAG TPA: c-type cytochrome [Acidobacteriaceae bacterium]|nr:c-type cytochrome [Acidobacteriaceae bacterium]
MFRLAAFIVVIAATAGLSGCRQDMQDQPRMFPQRGTAFFADGRSVRLQLANTIARGQLRENSYFYTGLENGKEGTAMPFPATMEVLERGQERFNVYCSPCHSRVGNGEGRIVERGYYQAANFHSLRLREAPAGHFFNVITHGFGAMPDYHAELAPADRWAVVAYIRALQLSQNATDADAAPGAHIVSLAEVADKEGLPSSFTEEDWLHPAKPSTIPAPAVSSQAATAPAPALSASLSSPKPQSQDGAARQSGAKSEEKSSQAEQKAGGGEQPPAAAPAETAGDAAAGKELYTQNCQICHQANRQGIPPLIPSLDGVVAKVGIPKIRQTVTNGVPTAKPPMPSFGSKFSAADIDNIIAFLKTKP